MLALKTEFTFAGFNFPRCIVSLPKGKYTKGKPRFCNSYYHAPKPLKGAHPGQGFYLGDVTQPFTRWQWADEVIRLGHTGWFCDSYGEETIRGIVVRLPHSRGFFAGWSMGEGMISEIDGYLYKNERDAAYAADSMAQHAADDEREYQAKDRAEQDIAEAREEIHAINKKALPLFVELRAKREYPAPICEAIRVRIKSFLRDRSRAFDLIAAREDDFWTAVR